LKLLPESDELIYLHIYNTALLAYLFTNTQ